MIQKYEEEGQVYDIYYDDEKIKDITASLLRGELSGSDEAAELIVCTAIKAVARFIPEEN